METKAPSLLSRVFECQACPQKFGFEAGEGGRYLKFPPTIGASGKADLLFVGINPRLSGNRPWLERLMRDRREFGALAENRSDGQAYIGAGGWERHYDVHARIVQDLYGADAVFEDHAAVSELFFCATVDTANGFPMSGSDCADEYFGDVLEQVQPKAIICLGQRVLRYMQSRFGGTYQHFFRTAGGTLVAFVPHPADNVTADGREVAVRAAVREIRVAVGRN